MDVNDPDHSTLSTTDEIPLADVGCFRVVELAGGRQPHRLTIDAFPTTATSARPGSQRCHRLLFVVAGELDSAAASGIINRCRPRWDGFDEVVVDLAGVTLIDSAGVRVIESLAQAVHETGHSFTMSAASPIVRRVLHVIGVSFPETIDPSNPPTPPFPNATHR